MGQKMSEYLPGTGSSAEIGQRMSECLPGTESCAKIGQKMSEYLPGTDSCAKIGQKMSEYLPDEEGRAKIGRFAVNFGRNAVDLGVHEGIKWVPGGSFVHKAILRSLPDKKNENLAEQVKTLESKFAMLEKQVSGSGAKISSPDTKSNSQTESCLGSSMNFQKPEDVISIFMMKEFVGREINQQILENLIVPGVGKYRK